MYKSNLIFNKRYLVFSPLVFYKIVRYSRLYKLLKPIDILLAKILERIPIQTNFDFKLFMRSSASVELPLNGSDDITVIMLKIIKEGELCIDIGAHCGYYTILFSKMVKEKGLVISFEPDKNNLSFLIRNVKYNKCINVKIYPYAVSDNDGFAFLSEDKKTGLDSYIIEKTKSNSKYTKIRTIMLDSLNLDKPICLLNRCPRKRGESF